MRFAKSDARFCGDCGRPLREVREDGARWLRCPRWDSVWSYLLGQSHASHLAGSYEELTRYDEGMSERRTS